MTSDLWTIKKALQAKLEGEAQFAFINARLILRAGIDLGKVDGPLESPETASKVCTLLQEMGFEIDDGEGL